MSNNAELAQFLKEHLRIETRHSHNRLEIVLKLAALENNDSIEIDSDFIDYTDVIRIVKDEMN